MSIPAETLEISRKLSRDIRDAAADLSHREVRFLVDSYYTMQQQRIGMGLRLGRMKASGLPCTVIDYMSSQSMLLEEQLAAALDHYSSTSTIGTWLRQNAGIGPITSAALIAYNPPDFLPLYASNLWSFAGLNPKQEWKKGQLCPWNPRLKALCWKIGEAFVKVSNRSGENYGKVYQKRKEYETALNEEGKYAAAAAAMLEKFNYGDKTEAKKSLLKGKLPKAQIHGRAKRYAVKLFLSHFHEVYFSHYHRMTPPPSYILAHPKEGEPHFDYIPPFVPYAWSSFALPFDQDRWNAHARKAAALKAQIKRELQEEEEDETQPTE